MISSGASMVVKLGVLGGMGPLATVDFLRKLVAATPAAVDQEHITTVVYSACHIPDRTAAILGTGPSPLQDMLVGARMLEQAGADCLAIPCNTAHYWHSQLVAATAIPIFHMVDAACDVVAQRVAPGESIGVLATVGTLRSGVYQERIEARGYCCLNPEQADIDDLIMPAIYKVKAADLDGARRMLARARDRLVMRGASQIIMGCTEIPLALDPTSTQLLVDATDALAFKCVDWWLERRLQHFASRDEGDGARTNSR